MHKDDVRLQKEYESRVHEYLTMHPSWSRRRARRAAERDMKARRYPTDRPQVKECDR